MTVTGPHGMAQASEDQVIVLWDACLFFFPTEHLDDIVALLQALQQEMNPNCPFCQEELAKYTENRCIHVNTA